MKKTLLKITISILAGTLFLTACKKDAPAPEETPPVNTTPPVFNWKINNGNTISSDSTYCYPSFTTIYAFKSGLLNSVEINLSSLNTGTYTISSATGNALTLVNGNVTYTASSGTVTIAASAGNKLSGNLVAGFSSGTVTALTATFTDVPKRN